MYYLYFGDDTITVRKEAMLKARHEADGADVFTFSDENLTSDILQSLVGATSLFRDREVFVLDTLSRNAGAFDLLRDAVPELQASPNLFIVVEEDLGAKDEKLLTSYAALTEKKLLPRSAAFNVFALSDALALRDKKSLWIQLLAAQKEGKTAEEIIGTLLWQLKCIRLSLHTQSAEEAGLKPFVYQKAKRALQKFSADDLTTYAHELVTLYHDGHAGRRNIDEALEAWVLGL